MQRPHVFSIRCYLTWRCCRFFLTDIVSLRNHYMIRQAFRWNRDTVELCATERIRWIYSFTPFPPLPKTSDTSSTAERDTNVSSRTQNCLIMPYRLVGWLLIAIWWGPNFLFKKALNFYFSVFLFCQIIETVLILFHFYSINLLLFLWLSYFCAHYIHWIIFDRFR